MRRTLGVLLAALATPLVLGVVLAVLLWLKLGLSLDARELGVVALNGLLAVYSLPVSLLVAAALGLPLALRLERRGERSARAHLRLGAALGMLPFAVLGICLIGYELVAAARLGLGDAVFGLEPHLGRLAHATPRAAAWLAIGALCGSASALTYWVIAVRRIRTPAGTAASALALVLLSASIGCSTRTETRVTDWCIRRETVGRSVGPWSGPRSSECLVRRWGLWWRLDELAVGPVLALDPDTVLLSVPGKRKLIRRGERRARPVCDDNEYGALPPGHDAIDCLGFVAGPAMGVPTSVRFQRLDIQGRPAGSATVLDADRGTGSRRVFMALAISYYDGARVPYFVTYDDSNLGHPDCALLELSGAGLRVHPAAPGTTLRECSDREAWSRVVGRTLHAPE